MPCRSAVIADAQHAVCDIDVNIVYSRQTRPRDLKKRLSAECQETLKAKARRAHFGANVNVEKCKPPFPIFFHTSYVGSSALIPQKATNRQHIAMRRSDTLPVSCATSLSICCLSVCVSCRMRPDRTCFTPCPARAVWPRPQTRQNHD